MKTKSKQEKDKKNMWQKPKENWSKLPHQFIDEVMPKIDSLSEMKVLLYVLRHTWGFGDSEKVISIDEFCSGRKRKDGTRLDSGTGMSENAVKSGINKAVEHGYLIVDIDDSDKARIKKSYCLSDPESNENCNVEGQKLTPKSDDCNVESNSEGQKLIPRGSEVDPRSEKDTLERNLIKPSTIFSKNSQTELEQIVDEELTIKPDTKIQPALPVFNSDESDYQDGLTALESVISWLNTKKQSKPTDNQKNDLKKSVLVVDGNGNTISYPSPHELYDSDETFQKYTSWLIAKKKSFLGKGKFPSKSDMIASLRNYNAPNLGWLRYEAQNRSRFEFDGEVGEDPNQLVYLEDDE